MRFGILCNIRGIYSGNRALMAQCEVSATCVRDPLDKHLKSIEIHLGFTFDTLRIRSMRICGSHHLGVVGFVVCMIYHCPRNYYVSNLQGIIHVIEIVTSQNT